MFIKANRSIMNYFVKPNQLVMNAHSFCRALFDRAATNNNNNNNHFTG